MRSSLHACHGRWVAALTVLLAGSTAAFADDCNGNGVDDAVELQELHFGPQQLLADPGVSTQSIHAADLDADGDADLLVGSYDAGPLAWHENLGDGTFGPRQAIDTIGGGARSASAVDLDGDGDLDVLAVLPGLGGTAWYANDGAGVFAPRQVLSYNAGNATAALAADLDGDGDDDILAAVSYGILWKENLGDGAFGDDQDVVLMAEVQALDACDLDGDGDLDVVWASTAADSIAWQENTGGGTFGPAQTISTDVVDPFSVRAADLDGDGDADVLSASRDDDKLAWYANQGDGTFGPQQLIVTPAYGGVLCVYAADLDQDGDADVLSGSDYDGDVVWYENQGGGVFGPEMSLATQAPDVLSIHTADLDGDGDLEVMWSAAHSLGRAGWHESYLGHDCNASGVPDECDLASGASDDCNANDQPDDCDLAAGIAEDCNLNGRPDDCDLVTAAFDAGHDIANWGGAVDAEVADFDGDGDTDVLAAQASNGLVVWYANDGRGTFAWPPYESYHLDDWPLGTWDAAAADLDGDGATDLLCAPSYGGQRIAWFENPGDGGFKMQLLLTDALQFVRSVHAADIDGDGDLDVLSTSDASGDLVWYENLGGGFGLGQLIDQLPPTRIVRVTDLDGDGDADVLVERDYFRGVLWYANHGAGAFGPAQLIGPGSGQLATADDLDGDGDADVAIASPTEFSWYANDGAGAFTIQQVLIEKAGVPWTNVATADLDGDGDADVLSASEEQDRHVAWYENRGGGVFGPQQLIADVARDVRTADIDGDGLTDVLVGHPNLLRWHKNIMSQDCNANGMLDECDIDAGVSMDLDADGVPDECQDCNGNGISDPQDLADCGWEFWCGDCNANGVLDICDIASGASGDCNENGGPDECDIAYGVSDDVDGNGIPDECDDCDGNGVGDPMDLANCDGSAWCDDCNGNGILDVCDRAAGTASDCNANGVPDACDVAGGTSDDCDGNGMPDECDLAAAGFGLPQRISATEDRGECVHTADLDGDGLMDVLAARGYDGIAWHRNLGEGTFTVARVISTAVDDLQALRTADLDGDGDLDVLSASAGDNKLAWYEHLGDGAFARVQTVITTELLDPRDICAADLDGDGDVDVLAASDQADLIAWCENDGAGAFAPPQTIASDIQCAVSVYAADLDGDGDVDVLSAAVCDGRVDWYENLTGDGYFGPRRAIDAEARDAGVVRAADLDGDGDPDVLAALWQNGELVWYENMGTRTFDPPRVLATAASTIPDVHPADIDGDGDVDVVFASAPTVRCCENLGGGGFGPERIVAWLADYVYGVHAADFDADGHVDLVSISGDQLAWYDNRLPNANDCNLNGTLDSCDVASGASPDADGNGIPDECEWTYEFGDLDCDGFVDTYDIEGFVLALTDRPAYAATYPNCNRALADCNGDGYIDTYDIDAFVALLTR